jgi:rhamnulokinase
VSQLPQPDAAKALVAIDLGAESCRVSLLRWPNRDQAGDPEIELLHRVPNGPEDRHGHLHWPLDRILDGIEDGLRLAAEAAPEGIRSIAVDGWAVDYVRLNPQGEPLHAPFCYRDERNIAAKAWAEKRIAPEEHFSITGAQRLRINTVYQLLADNQAGIEARIPWLLLPEYILYSLGGRAVAEYTNATHTGLVDLKTGTWSEDLFKRLGLAIEAAPPIVPSGTVLGRLTGPLADLPAFRDTLLIAPACHDTASAIAAVTADLSHTVYLVSGTWSLVGTVIDRPIATAEAEQAGFTNQGEAAGGYCFHTNINGMWLIKQCLDHWCQHGRNIALPALVAQAAEVIEIPGILNVDAPSLLLAGNMPERINSELTLLGLKPIADIPGNEPIFARLIFSSLAARYATTIANLSQLTGRSFRQISILGGGSRNKLLSQLTEQATGLPVSAGEAEGSTLGNFAVQLAALEAGPNQSPSAGAIRDWANRLTPRPAIPATAGN